MQQPLTQAAAYALFKARDSISVLLAGCCENKLEVDTRRIQFQQSISRVLFSPYFSCTWLNINVNEGDEKSLATTIYSNSGS
jgi:hypothetical protein